MKKNTEHQLDALLSEGLVKAPDHFSDQLVHRISLEIDSDHQSQSSRSATPPKVTTPLWQWLALGTASVAGVIQMTGFVFGVWVATAAG